MDINKFVKNNLLNVRVIPNSSRTELIEEKTGKVEKTKSNNNKLKLYLKAVPEKGKANKELIKFFKKEFKLKVEIKSGEKSRDKVLRIIG